MAKNAGDLILRDRMEFTLDSSGNRTTLYGRIDLSSFVSTINREGLRIKQVMFQVREQNSGRLANTGIWDPIAVVDTPAGAVAGMKIYATTRAYENASDVGIASPDVLCVEEWTSNTSIGDGTDQGTSYWCTRDFYGPKDLHPEGYLVVSDLLIGVAVDDWLRNADSTLEIDVLLVAEPTKVTQDSMNEILSQAQDL
jgi:hypothetical protein